jgi:hypothetical protein
LLYYLLSQLMASGCVQKDTTPKNKKQNKM